MRAAYSRVCVLNQPGGVESSIIGGRCFVEVGMGMGMSKWVAGNV